MMQQVAKALLEVAVKQPTSTPAPPPFRADLQPAAHVTAAQVQSLLQFREAALVHEVAGGMRAAVGRGGSRAGAAAASAEAFEERMDVAVRIGWAYIESRAFDIFTKVRSFGTASIVSRSCPC